MVYQTKYNGVPNSGPKGPVIIYWGRGGGGRATKLRKSLAKKLWPTAIKGLKKIDPPKTQKKKLWQDVAKHLNGCPVALFVHAHFRPRARGFCFRFVSVQHIFVHKKKLVAEERTTTVSSLHFLYVNSKLTWFCSQSSQPRTLTHSTSTTRSRNQTTSGSCRPLCTTRGMTWKKRQLYTQIHLIKHWMPKLLPGHYTLDGLVNEFTILTKNNPKFVINAKAHTPIAIMVIYKGNARFSHGLLQLLGLSQLSPITLVQRLTSPTTYFVHCDLIDKKQKPAQWKAFDCLGAIRYSWPSFWKGSLPNATTTMFCATQTAATMMWIAGKNSRFCQSSFTYRDSVMVIFRFLAQNGLKLELRTFAIDKILMEH